MAASGSDSLGEMIPYRMLIAEFEALYRGHVVRVMGDHDSSALTWMQRENGDWGILESAIGRCMTLQTAREDETKAVRKAAMMTLLLKMWCIQRMIELSECHGRWKSGWELSAVEYFSCVMCKAEFYKQWSAESICNGCKAAIQAAQGDDGESEPA